jgi:rhodanese-related sulfurtransferase
MGSIISKYYGKQTIRGIAVVIMFFLPFLHSCAEAPAQKKGERNIDSAMLVSLVKEKSAAIIDTMSYLECMDHRIPGSQCIALEDLDKKLPASVPDKKQAVIFYCESEKCPRAGLAYEKAKLLGYENIYVLEGGLSAWKKAGHEVEAVQRVKRAPVVSIKSTKLQTLLKEKKNHFVLDVRSEDAFRADHIEGAKNIPLYMLHKRLNEIPKNVPVIVVDENGKRSFLACCYLINNGVTDVTRLFGGMESIVRKERK